MKNFNIATLAGLLLLTMTAHASVETDIQQIRPLLPNGSDVAQIQSSIRSGSTEAEALEIAKANYLIRDINGDGRNDILVISEETAGKRALHLFYGQDDGELKLEFTNDKMILGEEDGGVFGDPLQGFTVTNNGSIQYSVYGGSSWRWSYTDTFQFRDGEFVVIGQDSYSGWTGDLRADTKSINLINGRVVETHQNDADAPVRTKTYRIKIQPLVKVSDYLGAME